MEICEQLTTAQILHLAQSLDYSSYLPDEIFSFLIRILISIVGSGMMNIFSGNIVMSIIHQV